MKTLLIVESPTKAKTISKFLGSEYQVESSFGHIRDLPKSDLGVDTAKDFTPKYVIPTKNRTQVSKLTKLAKAAKRVILATDEDREGEAIAWHLAEALKIDTASAERIVFHEITKDALQTAMETPRQIDMSLVDAQQARRILDRLVGYELSPFLWKKVSRGLSAGRVQSVAVRLVVEREREIKAFVPQEYWTIEGLFGEQAPFPARLVEAFGRDLAKEALANQTESDKALAELAGAKYSISSVERKEMRKSAPKPFTTSTLQQAANRLLGFSAKKTMVVAQQLYEGISKAGDGSGLITYMRTDSLNLSEKFLKEAGDYLRSSLGDKYALKTPRVFKTKSKGAQEAHEAIRPVNAKQTPESIQKALSSDQFRLYRLIWQRALASQMPEAVFDQTGVDIKPDRDGYRFRANGQVMRFDGFLRLYPEKNSDHVLPTLKDGQSIKAENIDGIQHFTKAPARYSDAGLVKELEKYGIGRPSTYAPTIATIEARNYVSRDEHKKLMPTDIAFVVNDLLVAHFPEIVDLAFTAGVEEKLDQIANSQHDWRTVIGEFYRPFHANLTIKYEEIKKNDVMPEETTDEVCDKCGAAMVVKTGRYGKFLACSGFPECRNIKNSKSAADPAKDAELAELAKKYEGEKCDKCGAAMVLKNGRYGPFLACSAYPTCKNLKNIKENGATGIKCPVCGEGNIAKKHSKRGVFYACDRYPDCKTAFNAEPTNDKCPKCGAIMLKNADGDTFCSDKKCK